LDRSWGQIIDYQIIIAIDLGGWSPHERRHGRNSLILLFFVVHGNSCEGLLGFFLIDRAKRETPNPRQPKDEGC
jgi:hypothetical protein